MPTTAPLRRLLLTLTALALAAAEATAQGPVAPTFEDSRPPGANYDKAEFRLWQPAGPGALRAVVVLVPGSNGDGRSMVDDPAWQAFATRHRLALVGCRFTDRTHEQMFIEHYVNVSQGSGQALLDALGAFAEQARRPELATAPLFLWGMSAGGQFNYEFAAWRPERVAAFVVNKGGIYYSALVSREARRVPGMFFTGEKDLAFRTNTIVGLFAVNRRAGALWSLVEEPGVGHEVARSKDLGILFFDEVLPLRLPASSSGSSATLNAIDERAGLIGELGARTVQPMGTGPAPGYPTAWLPTPRVARAWQAVVAGQPIDP